jgi:L-lactate utilization protein LutB
VRIPLHELLLGLRRDRAVTSAGRLERLAFRAWSTAWSHPWLYRLTTRTARHMHIRGQAPFMHVPLLKRWARTRDVVVKR